MPTITVDGRSLEVAAGRTILQALDDVTFDTAGPAPVPEPAGFLMMGTGLVLVWLVLRRRASKA